PRRHVRVLAWVAAAAVLAQATLGGLTVLFKLQSLGISLAHAGLAQLFFASTVALAVLSSGAWRAGGAPIVDARGPSLRALATATAIAVYAQILLGGWVRYTPGAPYRSEEHTSELQS